jgi:hypothetical protein
MQQKGKGTVKCVHGKYNVCNWKGRENTNRNSKIMYNLILYKGKSGG